MSAFGITTPPRPAPWRDTSMEAARRWTASKEAMHVRAGELAAHGCDQDAIAARLAADFPGMRSERDYLQAAGLALADLHAAARRETERRRADRAWRIARGLPEQDAPPPAAAPAPAPPPMSASLLAFAGASGYRCALCSREGDVFGDADRDAWRQFRRPGTAAYVLACTACAGQPAGKEARHGLGG